jgi:hypothetical protein
MKFARTIGWLSGAVIGSILAGSLWMIYLGFFDHRVPPLMLTYSHPVAVEYGAKSKAEIKEAHFVKSGSAFYSYREFCVNYRFITIESQRVLVRKSDPHEVWPLPKIGSRVDAALGCVTKTFGSTVPAEVPPGEYIYRSGTVYMVVGNPIATFVYDWPDVDVVVVPK